MGGRVAASWGVALCISHAISPCSSPSLTLFLPHTLALSPSLSLLSHSLLLSLFLSLPHSLPHSLSTSLSLTPSAYLTLSLSSSLTLFLPHSLPTLSLLLYLYSSQVPLRSPYWLSRPTHHCVELELGCRIRTGNVMELSLRPPTCIGQQ